MPPLVERIMVYSDEESSDSEDEETPLSSRWKSIANVISSLKNESEDMTEMQSNESSDRVSEQNILENSLIINGHGTEPADTNHIVIASKVKQSTNQEQQGPETRALSFITDNNRNL